MMRRHCLCMIISVATFIMMNLVGAEEQKRAPSGFTGVRGKKSIPDSAYSETSEAPDNSRESGVALEKRAPSGFFGMRGKKPFEGWISSAQQDYLEDVYKRATLGFTGMRGKKMDFGDEFEKRAPNGFVGMRGKKLLDGEDVKKDPSGFFGMRGKKEYDSLIEEEKRMNGLGSQRGFFGMRGKKQPGRVGFFGMRGKKFPYDVRGKFVGVRGKKWISTQEDYDDSLSYNVRDDNMDMQQLLFRLMQQRPVENETGYWNEKSDDYIVQQLG